MHKFSPQIDSPLFIVTCEAGGTMAGCLVGFGTQCSMRPPRFLVCLSVLNRTYEVADRASALAVHVLSKADEGLAAVFGEETGDEVDKFSQVRWSPGVSGAPVLADCAVWFEGAILTKVPFGDHVGFVLSPLEDVDAEDDLEDRQLALRDVGGFRPGHPADEESPRRQLASS